MPSSEHLPEDAPFMASLIDIVWVNCEDLFRGVDVEAMLRRQKNVLTDGNLTNYPSTILISSARITLGINLADKIGPVDYSRLLIGDQSIPQEGQLFDWGFVEEPGE